MNRDFYHLLKSLDTALEPMVRRACIQRNKRKTARHVRHYSIRGSELRKRAEFELMDDEDVLVLIPTGTSKQAALTALRQVMTSIRGHFEDVDEFRARTQAWETALGTAERR